MTAESTCFALALALETVFLAFFVRHVCFAVTALRSARSDSALPLGGDGFLPPVTVLVACKNEAAVVDALVAALEALDYPHERLQLIVVDDGSTDATWELLRHAQLTSRVQCLRRSASDAPGKSSALNHALTVATGDVIVVFDADHTPEPDVVRRLVRHFRDPSVAAVQGRCKIANSRDSMIARLVALDYLGGYLVNEYGRQSLFELPAYGGANCAVRASTLREMRGWNPASVTEDTDLTLRLLLTGYRVRYDVTAVDREEGVVTLGRFWKQRYRWARGHQQACRDYRKAVWKARQLSVAERVEATMFLFAFHIPVLSGVGLLIVALWASGLVQAVDPLHLAVMWTLLFLGPLLELGAGMLIARTERREVFALAFFLPLFFVSIALCTQAWVDSLRRQPYEWVKTARAADVVVTG